MYRMHDANPAGMFPIPRAEAEKWNRRGFGIFATVQKFRDGIRRISNLERIRAWAIDIDAGTKKEQAKRIAAAKLIPSSVVETKSGYHAYWYAKEARPESYRPLVTRLVEFFNADPRARDLARVLRVPGYLHLKDPENPFLVKHVHGPVHTLAYTERQMFAAFPPSSAEQERSQRARPEHGTGDGLWDQIYNLDCLAALQMLSGSGYVGGERYEFKRTGRGKHNVVVDGKSTSCFVDEAGRLGGGGGTAGPTVIQWLSYYGHSKAECVRIVRELFPHVEQS